MLNMIIVITKVALLALWLACLLSLFSVLPEQFGRPILWAGGFILLLHLVEYFAVRAKVAERQNGDTGFIGTMVFGFGYWLPVLKDGNTADDRT